MTALQGQKEEFPISLQRWERPVCLGPVRRWRRRQKLLWLLGCRDQRSSDLTKARVNEYLGKQMSERMLPSAPPGELVWQQADRPRGLACFAHSSGHYFISPVKIPTATFAKGPATLPICWILQDHSVPLFRTPLRFQASIFHVYVSLKGQLVSFQNPLQPKQEDPDVRQSAPARPSTVVHTLTGEKGNSWSFGFRTGKR